MTDGLTQRLALAVQSARASRGLSVNALATASGVSRAMIAKIERSEVQPTAALLARLSGSLGLTLSELIARAEGNIGRLTRADDQPIWVDPVSGYRRRAISPAGGAPLELIQVDLPAGRSVSFGAETYTFIHQQIWVLEGRLTFTEAAEVHQLDAGDCLQLGPPMPCTFANATEAVCRYLVALTRRPS